MLLTRSSFIDSSPRLGAYSKPLTLQPYPRGALKLPNSPGAGLSSTGPMAILGDRFVEEFLAVLDELAVNL